MEDVASTRALDEEHRRFLRTKMFGSLDGLRAMAILAVVWHHSGDGSPGLVLSKRGFLGVDLFFVISGFLIVTLLLRERRARGSISLRHFYWRRVLRIFPPYYLLIGITAGMAIVAPGNTSEATLRYVPYALLYLTNFVPAHGSMLGISWSLSTEEQFYLLIPSLEKHAARAMRLVLPAAYVLAMLPTFRLFPDVPLPAFFRHTTYAPILLGTLLAHALDDTRGFRWVFHLLGGSRAPVLVIGASVVLLCSLPEDISGWPRVLLHWSFASLVASCVVREDNGLRSVLAFPPLRRIGIVSYGIYLYHLLVLHFFGPALARLSLSGQGILFTSVAAGTWLVAEVSYRGFESRFLALKDRAFVPPDAPSASPKTPGGPRG